MKLAQWIPSTDPQDDRLSTGVKWSLIVHLAFGIFILLKSLIFPGTPELYTPTLRVDLVALPDLLKSEKDRIQSLTSPKVDPQSLPSKADDSKEEMALKQKKASKGEDKRQERISNALAKIKALAKIQEEAPDQIKGNILSKGTTLSGEAKEAAEPSYYDDVVNRVRANWSLPTWLARQNLSARVQIFIDSQGKVQGIRFHKPSGNAQFDEAVQKAISKSQPFDSPPKDMAATLLTRGVFLGFPL